MKRNLKKFFLKVTNPQKGTYHLLVKICSELKLRFEEYWQKSDDPDIKLYIKPVFSKGFNHIVILYSRKKPYVEFAKYLVEEYINSVEKLENMLLESHGI